MATTAPPAADSGTLPGTDPAPEHPELASMLAVLGRMGLHAADAGEVRRALEQMVMHADYPCLGAKSVFRRDGVRFTVLDDMDSARAADELLRRLEEFAADGFDPDGFHSFIVSFREPVPTDEAGFERSLFALLQRLHDADGAPWAGGVEPDPADPHFAFSVRGTAYFIVGLHPAASRVARRAPLPTLVFNPHEQFERLREEGRYDRMRSRIRSRDEDLQGTVNPMVADHGESSEARQYSGRFHGPDWVPPLDVHEEGSDQ